MAYGDTGFDFGIQRTGFAPSAQAILTKGKSYTKALLDPNFDFEKWQRTENPFVTGTGPDAQAVGQMDIDAFDQLLIRNDAETLQHYADLRLRTEGYQFDTPRGIVDPNSMKAKRYERSNAAERAGRFSPLGGSILASKTSRRENVTTYKSFRIGDTNPRDDRGAGPSTFKVDTTRNPGAVTAIDEYMLWRYDVRYSQTRQDVGAGESEDYTGFSSANFQVDKTTAQLAGQGQAGPVTAGGVGRHERQSGKSQFTTRGVQL